MKILNNKLLRKLCLSSVVLMVTMPLRADIYADLITLCNNNPSCKKAVQVADAKRYQVACKSVPLCADNVIYKQYIASVPKSNIELTAFDLNCSDQLDCNNPEVASKNSLCNLKD